MGKNSKGEGGKGKMRFLLLPTARPMDVDVYLCGCGTHCDHCPSLQCQGNNCQTQTCQSQCVTQCATKSTCTPKCGTLGLSFP